MRLLLRSLSIMVGYLVVKSGGQSYNGGCGGPPGSGPVCGTNCTNVKPSVCRSLRQVYLDRDLFVNFCPYSELSLQFDNICYTFFPAVGNNNVYVFYISRVYKNGTNEILSYLTTQYTLGEFKTASPDCSTFTDTVIGTDQCGTYLNYRCYPCEGCPVSDEYYEPTVYGLTRRYQPMEASCLDQAVKVIRANGVPPQQYIRLPMRLPPRCVTSQPCVNYPTAESD